MRVVILGERFGRIRDAFIKRGHDAWSCDLAPTEVEGPHFQCDMFEVIGMGWDLVIAHPDCTYLTVAGNRWYAGTKKRKDAIKFVEKIWNYPGIEKLMIENPVSVLSTQSCLGKPSQYIHPWQFGHGETKKTCLWLRGLPVLVPTNIVEGREQRVWKMSPSENRRMERSKTYQGWADAMAEQWG